MSDLSQTMSNATHFLNFLIHFEKLFFSFGKKIVVFTSQRLNDYWVCQAVPTEQALSIAAGKLWRHAAQPARAGRGGPVSQLHQRLPAAEEVDFSVFCGPRPASYQPASPLYWYQL